VWREFFVRDPAHLRRVGVQGDLDYGHKDANNSATART